MSLTMDQPPLFDLDAPPETAAPAPAGPKRGSALGAAALLLVGAAAGALGWSVIHPVHKAAATTPTANNGNLNQPQPGPTDPGFPGFPGGIPTGPSNSSTVNNPTAAAAAAAVDPAIVNITTTLYGGGRAAGTGMVLTSDGEVLTNNHVIEGATTITAYDVGNGQSYSATVVGYDRSHDVAVIQLSRASGLKTITASTSTPAIGSTVVGVGNAGGHGGTPSFAIGSIIAVDQSITASDEATGTSEKLSGLLETDAAIVAGDSGGPLVDTQGHVVGMDTAGSASYQFSRTGDGFAIPIATALSTVHDIDSGTATETVHIGPTAFMGIGVAQGQNGVEVQQVVNGAPAAKAGLVAGDTIVGIGGSPIATPEDLTTYLLHLRPGQTISVTYYDTSGTQRTTRLTLSSGPAQ